MFKTTRVNNIHFLIYFFHKLQTIISLQDTDDIRSKHQTLGQLFTFKRPMVGSLT